MSDRLITKEELYQILKKRKHETDQIDGKYIEKQEDINELIIKNEAEKFLELFEKVFSSEEEEEQLDSEDGLVQEIFSGIVVKIKEELKLINKSQILKFIFNFFVKETDTKNIDGKDKSDSA